MKLQEKSPEFSKYRAKVVAISSDPEDVIPATKDNKLGFAVLADPSQRTIKKFGVPLKNGVVGTLATIIVDDTGVVRYSKIAQSDFIAEEALEALQAIQEE